MVKRTVRQAAGKRKCSTMRPRRSMSMDTDEERYDRAMNGMR
jgi:hypothetical protein